MVLFIHRIAASIAYLCITLFFLATVGVEVLGSFEAITKVKSLIVWPGLFILVPCIAITGISGGLLAKARSGSIVQQKKERMPLIALNGIFILIPCAIILDHWAAQGAFDLSFYIVQAVELMAGATNLILMSKSIRDGMAMSGRFRKSQESSSRIVVHNNN